MSEERKTKSQETADRILEASLQLFLEEGYEKTTMRSIAQKAGMSLGAAYYYFPTKEHIIFAFYTQSFTRHLDHANEVVRTEKKLENRIAGIVKALLNEAQPYHKVSRALFKVAADPGHPLSPFSPESLPLRERSMTLYASAIEGAQLRGTKISGAVGGRLPELLWLYQIAVILYWLFDNSENREKTYRLVDRSSVILVRMLQAASLPLGRTIVTPFLKLLDEFKPYA